MDINHSLTPPETPRPARPWTGRRILFLGVIGAIAAASLTAGVRLMHARSGTDSAEARDAVRFEDLQAIVAQVQDMYQAGGKLPASLEEIEKTAKGRLSVADPETFEVYEYRVLDEKRYEVCASFERASSGGPSEHGVGRSCFQVVMNDAR